MRAVRLLHPLREVAVLPLQRVVLFSSCSEANKKSANYFTSDATEGRSGPKYYRKFKWTSANFVGTVEEPLKVRQGKGDILAWTFLRVKVPPESHSTFRILLNLWGKMAESSLERLKPNDFVYVAGTLEAYKRADNYRKSNLYYQLTVRELNYIAQHDESSRSKNYEDMRLKEGETSREKHWKRLHLWQVFFSNPDEWWDNRKGKSNPAQPDFKNKDTGEALWLGPMDPPWIRKQLELLDAKMVKQKMEHFGSDSSISKWLYG